MQSVFFWSLDWKPESQIVAQIAYEPSTFTFFVLTQSKTLKKSRIFWFLINTAKQCFPVARFNMVSGIGLLQWHRVSNIRKMRNSVKYRPSTLKNIDIKIAFSKNESTPPLFFLKVCYKLAPFSAVLHSMISVVSLPHFNE